MNTIDKAHPANCLYSVQSVVVDPKDRLWALDTGSVKLGPNVPGGPKLVCMDLEDKHDHAQDFLSALGCHGLGTYLNDVRFDLRRGKAGTAFITDSGTDTTGLKPLYGIIVVDLATGKSFRRLAQDPTVVSRTKASSALSDGVPLMERKHRLVAPGAEVRLGRHRHQQRRQNGCFTAPMSSRQLYSVSVDAMMDQSKSEERCRGHN